VKNSPAIFNCVQKMVSSNFITILWFHLFLLKSIFVYKLIQRCMLTFEFMVFILTHYLSNMLFVEH